MTRHLRDDETFQSNGHLTEVALTALTDGEDELLSPGALEHAASCDACAERMGDLALLAVEVNEALAVRPEVAPALAPARAPLPLAAMLVALTIAVIGAIPTLLAAPAWLADLPAGLLRTAPITLRATSTLFRAVSAEASLVTVAWMTATTVLIALGLLVARAAPRQAHRFGGGR
jgi:hypothetical protein